MSFLSPLAIVFGISLPLLAILYLLKVRRRPRRVSSTMLWREAIEDARASVPFQKLRRNLLLLLQLIVLALLTLALMRPVLNLVATESASAILLVDVSASMGMKDRSGARTRLEEARDKAQRYLETLPDKSQAMLIAYADRATVAVPFTADRARLSRALEALEVRATGDVLAQGLSLAVSMLGSAPNPRLVVFSDSAEIDSAQIERLSGTPLVIESCGEAAPNIGWTAMDLRRRSATSTVYDFFAQAAAFGGVEREATIRLETGDRLLAVRKVTLTDGRETAVLIENLDIEDRAVVRCVITPAGDESDALAADDVLWAEARSGPRIRLLLCTAGNYFLSRALATAGAIEVTEVAPGEEPPEREYDVAIYDRAVPSFLPAAPALFIDVNPWQEDSEQAPAEREEETPAGAITNWDAEHPVTGIVQWSTVTVYGARPGTLAPGSRVLVEAGDLPIVVLGRAGEQVALFLTFDLFRSNFPLRAGFPIFIKRAVDWLTEEHNRGASSALKGGEAFSIRVPEQIERVAVLSPGGEEFVPRIGPDRIVSFTETYTPGLWTVEFDGAEVASFGVNLLNVDESNPRVVESSSIAAGGEVRSSGLDAELKTNREVWKWVAQAALVLLVLEWFVYRRRVAV